MALDNSEREGSVSALCNPCRVCGYHGVGPLTCVHFAPGDLGNAVRSDTGVRMVERRTERRCHVDDPVFYREVGN